MVISQDEHYEPHVDLSEADKLSARDGHRRTRVIAEETSAVDPSRLGKSVGYLRADEMRRVDAALRIVLAL